LKQSANKAFPEFAAEFAKLTKITKYVETQTRSDSCPFFRD